MVAGTDKAAESTGVAPVGGRGVVYIQHEEYRGIDGGRSGARDVPDGTREISMHVVIGVLTAVAGLIWALVALQRAGIDLGWLNPFLWQRRRKWQQRYREKPLYTLTKPIDVAAVLLLGVAKCEGEISAQQKAALLEVFHREFKIGSNEAADLLLASSYMIRNELYLVDNLDKLLELSHERFSDEQVSSLLSLMDQVARIESPPNQEQERLIAATSGFFRQRRQSRGKWQTERG
jgi:uncharacterized tellurite resistance protein B-like protein